MSIHAQAFVLVAGVVMFFVTQWWSARRVWWAVGVGPWLLVEVQKARDIMFEAADSQPICGPCSVR